MILFALAGLAIVALHLTLGLHQANRARAIWAAVDDDSGDVTGLALAVKCQDATLHSSSVGIAQAREAGDVPEAERILGLAAAVIQEMYPDRTARLRAMGELLRMAGAIQPLPPVAAGSFALGRLGVLTGMAAVLHHLMVAPVERFALRLSTLRLGFWLAMGVATRAHAEQQRRERAWIAFEAALQDFRTLDRETLESYRAFVAGVRAQPKTAPQA